MAKNSTEMIVVESAKVQIERGKYFKPIQAVSQMAPEKRKEENLISHYISPV